MLRPTYPIETERLLLRPYAADDFEAALTYWGRPDVTRFLYLNSYSREEFGERLDVLAGRTELLDEGDVLTLAIVPRDLGVVVGDVTMFWRSVEHQQGEVGFILHPDHQGKGYATEATRPLLRLGFEDMGLHRLTGRLDSRNEASAAVLRRLGMRQEAHLVQNERVKGEWTDESIFAILREEWLAQQNAAPGR